MRTVGSGKPNFQILIICVFNRWVEEGELSYYEVAHFFPDNVKLRGHDLITFGLSSTKPTYSSLSKMAKELASYLYVTHLPAPDLLFLAKRYIEELQLPGLYFIFHILHIYFMLYVLGVDGHSQTLIEFESQLEQPLYMGKRNIFVFVYCVCTLIGEKLFDPQPSHISSTSIQS
jgi:hypothetical protein